MTDLRDLDRWAADGPPHAFFSHLRETAPVWRHPAEGDRRHFVVAAHDLVIEAGRDTATFSSAQELGGVIGLGPGDEFQDEFDRNAAAAGLPPTETKQLLTLDPPDHSRHRRLVSRGFSPRDVLRLEAATRQLACDLLEGRAGEVFDFTEEVAMPLPMQVIGDLLGIDRTRHRDLLRWSNESVAATDAEYRSGDDSQMAAAANLANLFLAERQARDPANATDGDILDILSFAQIDGAELNPIRFIFFLLQLVTAGNETTRNAMSHGIAALADHPEQWELLRTDRSRIPAAVEEIVRWASPILYFRRNVTTDVEFGGQSLTAGDFVSLWYVSSNRDEAVFVDPERFDITRDPNPHVSFGGGGAHFCLGAALARLEIRVLLEEMLDRFERIERHGEPVRLRSNFLHGVKHLPIRLQP